MVVLVYGLLGSLGFNPAHFHGMVWGIGIRLFFVEDTYNVALIKRLGVDNPCACTAVHAL